MSIIGFLKYGAYFDLFASSRKLIAVIFAFLLFRWRCHGKLHFVSSLNALYCASSSKYFHFSTAHDPSRSEISFRKAVTFQSVIALIEFQVCSHDLRYMSFLRMIFFYSFTHPGPDFLISLTGQNWVSKSRYAAAVKHAGCCNHEWCTVWR